MVLWRVPSEAEPWLPCQQPAPYCAVSLPGFPACLLVALEPSVQYMAYTYIFVLGAPFGELRVKSLTLTRGGRVTVGKRLWSQLPGFTSGLRHLLVNK